MLSLSELSAQRYALEAAHEDTQDPLRPLSIALTSVQSALAIELRLDSWFEGFKASVPGALYRPELSRTQSALDNEDTGKIFPVAFQFPAISIAISTVYYWFALMATQAHLCFTYADISRLVAGLDAAGRESFSCTCEDESQQPCLRHFSTHQLPPLGPRESWPGTTAYNLAQSVEYFMEHGMNQMAHREIIPALVMVQAFWTCAPGDWSREVAWVEERMSSIGHGHGHTKPCPSGCVRRPINKDLQAYVCALYSERSSRRGRN